MKKRNIKLQRIMGKFSMKWRLVSLGVVLASLVIIFQNCANANLGKIFKNSDPSGYTLNYTNNVLEDVPPTSPVSVKVSLTDKTFQPLTNSKDANLKYGKMYYQIDAVNALWVFLTISIVCVNPIEGSYMCGNTRSYGGVNSGLGKHIVFDVTEMAATWGADSVDTFWSFVAYGPGCEYDKNSPDCQKASDSFVTHISTNANTFTANKNPTDEVDAARRGNVTLSWNTMGMTNAIQVRNETFLTSGGSAGSYSGWLAAIGGARVFLVDEENAPGGVASSEKYIIKSLKLDVKRPYGKYYWKALDQLAMSQIGAIDACTSQGMKVPTKQDVIDDHGFNKPYGLTVKKISGAPAQLHWLADGPTFVNGTCNGSQVGIRQYPFYRPAMEDTGIDPTTGLPTTDVSGDYVDNCNGEGNSGNGAYVICVY